MGENNTGRRRVRSFYEELLVDDPKEKARMRLEARAAARERAAEESAAGGASAGSESGASGSGRRRASHAHAACDASFVDRAVECGAAAGSAVVRGLRHKVGMGSADVPVWGILLVAALIAVVAFSFARGFQQQVQDPLPAPQTPGQEQPVFKPEPVQADFSKLPESLDRPIVEKLQAQAPGNDKLSTIINEADVLAFQGPVTQRSLLRLAANEPASYDFVLGINERYPSDTAQSYNEPVTKGRIPLLLQWDMRWGYVTYSSAPLGLSGCCPTALSMVYMGLTGKTDKTPYDMAMLAREGGYESESSGTFAQFLIDAAPQLGLYSESFKVDAGMLVDYLQSGWVVVVNVGRGDFSESGHFIVACGLSADGEVVVNDPFSPTRSAKTWTAEELAGQSIGMYAFMPR